MTQFFFLLQLAASAYILLSPPHLQADDFPPVYNSEQDQSAQPMAPLDAASQMQVPNGFRVSVFAAEPDVQNPIAMAWDESGRMWVAENFTYAERQQRFDLSLRDRVVIFSDTDNDGRPDSRTVFTDNVQMLTSVEVGHGGVWLMCPPQLLFIPDADKDAVADGPARVVLDGFTVSQDNYHNFANGLRWGPDGWLYGRCGHSCPGRLGIPGTPDADRVPIDGGIWRFHPERTTVEVLCHGTVNPWGHDWDANGELFFINTVIGHLWHMLPGSHMKESFGESMNPLVYERLDSIADHYHFDTNGNWSQSRDGKANDHGGGHAHIGMMIYQGQQWPQQYQGKLFTLNMHGRRANVERLERSSTGFVGRHEPDFLVAKDPFFRGIDIQTGPDGNAFVIDWSDTGECHDHTGVHRSSGRIFRISYDSETQAQLRFKSPIPKPACMGGAGRLPTLWRQYQARETTPDQLRKLLIDDDEHVRIWAIRLLTDLWPLDTIMGPLPSSKYPDDPQTLQQFIRMAGQDSSGLVLLTLASTLQRLSLQDRPLLAAPLMKRSAFKDDSTLPFLIWFALMPLAETDPAAVQRLSADCRAPKLQQWISRSLGAQMDSHPQLVEQHLSQATSFQPEQQVAVLNGLHNALRAWRKIEKPASWDAFAAMPAIRKQVETVREMNIIFGDGKALNQIRAIALQNEVDMKTRVAALQTLIGARPDDLRQICESLLNERIINTVAARGLATFDEVEIGEKMVRSYRRFQPEDRPAVLDLLTSRPEFAQALLSEIRMDSGQIPSTDLTAVHARQIRNLGNSALNQLLKDSWGELRDSPSDRVRIIHNLRQELAPERLTTANLSDGRQLFRKTCSQCHKLYDDGAEIGPNLTGSQRANLDYLLENIIDPSAVVGKDYRMSIVVLNDGRTLNGLVVSQNSRTLVLQSATDRLSIDTNDIEEMRQTSNSPMPDGLLNNLTPRQIENLFAYIMHPQQVSLPSGNPE